VAGHPEISPVHRSVDLLVVATLGCAGLIAHELRSARVVHFLQVAQRPGRLGDVGER